MILQRLKELRGQIEGKVIPAYHKQQQVRWFLEISEDGRFVGLTETGKTKKEWTEIIAPYIKRSGASPPPFLLVDKPAYVLGVAEGESSKKKAAQRHDAYRALVQECADAISNPHLNAYMDFLERHVNEARTHSNVAEMKPGDLIAPRVGDVILTKLPEVHRFWQEMQGEEAAGSSDFESSCMLCDQFKPIAKTHPIELVVGADRVGLITGNKDAFLSFGLEQSEIAPLCHVCAREYGEALRYLLQSDENHLYSANGVWLFWAREEMSINVVSMLSDPDPEQVKRLINSAQRGSMPEVGTNQFYALFSSANTSRMVIRSWIETTAEKVQLRLAQYFERQRIIGFQDEEKPLNVYALAGALVRRFDDLPAQVIPALIEHALRGTPLPLTLLQRAVQRARADRDQVMTRPRAALIKLVLLSQFQHKEGFMVEAELTTDHPNPAYHCGRLLALLDDIQRSAVRAKATLVDRYYGSASATPASVFGVLVRNAQSHLGKLRKNKPGLHHYFEQRLGEVTDHLTSFPRTLTMEEQGLFALGFYQQKHRSRKQAQINTDPEESSNKGR